MSEPTPKTDEERLAAELDEAAEAEAIAEAEAEARASLSVEDLVAAGDADGLIELAMAYRTGRGSVERDMQKCFEAYEKAAELGSAKAQHALGLFYLNGGVVDKDPKQAALSFRSAADGGYLAAKVSVGNLYELGIHYSADESKANVWYRSAARSAGVDTDEESFEYAKAMADLGCVRYCLALTDASDLPPDERKKYERKARLAGYRSPGETPRASTSSEPNESRASDESAKPAKPAASQTKPKAAGAKAEIEPTLGGKIMVGDVEIDLDAELADLKEEAAAEAERAAKEEEEAARAEEAREKKAEAAKKKQKKETKEERIKREAREKVRGTGPQWTVGPGLTAFLYALIGMGLGMGLGHGLMLGTADVVAAGQTIPLVGTQTGLLLPASIAVIGVLPNFLVYRAAAVGKALLAGILGIVVGEGLWGAGQHFAPDRLLQLTYFAAGAFLLALFAFGIRGGAKKAKVD